jgi:deoxyribodipyrimidine photo-lyase
MVIDQHQAPRRQQGGRSEGLAVLNSFINARSQKYRGGISSPLSAPTACSRISAYLAFGCISLREVVKATQLKLLQLPLHETRQRLGLNAFVSRLYWHCHFIQKLESEPAIEHQNMHRGYNGFREKDFNQAHFDALINARTGWPLVDACVTMLNQTGWLNFRMRAMLVSTAAYPLFLHWRPVGEWLARQFLDYEPGIHWSQMQMQSGTTGGQFVRQWLPYMRDVPGSWLFEPWRMPAVVQKNCGVFVGQDIPVPIVDLDNATREAKAKLFALRAKKSVKAGKADIVERHGSRKIPTSSPGQTVGKRTRQKVVKNSNQLGFDF